MEKNELLIPDVFTLLDSVEWGVSIFDGDGKFVWVNRYVLQCSGRSRKFYDDKTVYDFQNLGILNAPVCSEVLKTKKKATHLQRSYSENGKLKEFIVTATPIFDGDGNIKFVVADRIEMDRLKELYNLGLSERRKAVQSNMKVQPKKHEFIYKSSEMKQIVDEIQRAASVVRKQNHHKDRRNSPGGCGFPSHCSHQPAAFRLCGKQNLPAGPLLPAECNPHYHSSAAGT